MGRTRFGYGETGEGGMKREAATVGSVEINWNMVDCVDSGEIS